MRTRFAGIGVGMLLGTSISVVLIEHDFIRGLGLVGATLLAGAIYWAVEQKGGTA
jgi:hypothetical protein